MLKKILIGYSIVITVILLCTIIIFIRTNRIRSEQIGRAEAELRECNIALERSREENIRSREQIIAVREGLATSRELLQNNETELGDVINRLRDIAKEIQKLENSLDNSSND